MRNGTRLPRPKAREDDLVVEELPDEVVVYDLRRHKAHCLNRTAAMVWKRCDGRTTVPDNARRVGQESQTPISDEVVWLALDDLGKSHLLQARVGSPPVSRREALRLGLAGAVVFPLVTSILAPTAAQAASLVTVIGPVPGCDQDSTDCLKNGNPQVCTKSSECCSCCCHTNTGDPADAHCTSGTGGVVPCIVG